MFNESHDLTLELPEYREAIHRMKQSSQHFARLFEEHHVVDRELHRIEEELETPSDAVVEDLKKKRLALKDQLFTMLKKAG